MRSLWLFSCMFIKMEGLWKNGIRLTPFFHSPIAVFSAGCMREELSENPWHCCTFLMVEWKNGGFALTFSPMVCYDASVLQGTSNQRSV